MGAIIVIAGIAAIVFSGVYSVFSKEDNFSPLVFALLGLVLVILGGFVYVQGS